MTNASISNSSFTYMSKPASHLTSKLFKKSIPKKAPREGYGRGVVWAGKRDKNIVVLSADVMESTCSHYFANKFPDRFIETGVAEQNMTGIAAGLALSGKIPFIATFAVFSPGRNWDQIRISICYPEANVKIMGSHAGVTVGPDGASHQGVEDIAIARSLPNLTVIEAADAMETEKAVLEAAQKKGPVYIRFGRVEEAVITTKKSPFAIGQAEVFRPGKDATVVACGSMVYQALEAAESLKNKIDVEVINCHTIKPLDKKTILTSLKKTGCLVTCEEHHLAGGLGSAIAEMINQNHPVPQEFIAMPDVFGQSGQAKELLAEYNMDKQSIVLAINKVIKRK